MNSLQRRRGAESALVKLGFGVAGVDLYDSGRGHQPYLHFHELERDEDFDQPPWFHSSIPDALKSKITKKRYPADLKSKYNKPASIEYELRIPLKEALKHPSLKPHVISSARNAPSTVTDLRDPALRTAVMNLVRPPKKINSAPLKPTKTAHPREPESD